MHLTFLLDGALKYEHGSAVEGVPDGSPEGTLMFEVEIKGVFEFTIELHLKMHMVVHLLVQQSAKKDSIKVELEKALYVALEAAPRISLNEARKIAKKCEEKDAFDVAVDGPLESQIWLFKCPLYLI